MTTSEDLTNLMASMSEEEMRARSEAAAIGRMRIAETVIRALVASSAVPAYIAHCVDQTLTKMESEKPPIPELAWSIQAIADGARPLAEAIVEACESNPNWGKPPTRSDALD